jgi:hypothetical protein
VAFIAYVIPDLMDSPFMDYQWTNQLYHISSARIWTDPCQFSLGLRSQPWSGSDAVVQFGLEASTMQWDKGAVGADEA